MKPSFCGIPIRYISTCFVDLSWKSLVFVCCEILHYNLLDVSGSLLALHNHVHLKKCQVQIWKDMVGEICHALTATGICVWWSTLRSLALARPCFMSGYSDIAKGRIFWEHLHFYSIRKPPIDIERVSIYNVKICWWKWYCWMNGLVHSVSCSHWYLEFLTWIGSVL